MCTAFSFLSKDHYFGRNLDLDYRYNETVTITPRNYPLTFISGASSAEHYAMIGIATVMNGYPLYYEGINEAGLCTAGLNFPGNAHYPPYDPSKENIATFELIPWVLSFCRSVDEAIEKISGINLCDTPFSEALSPTPLHWIIADATKSVTLEPLSHGLTVTPNPIGVLTNNPPFDYHLNNLRNYMNLTPMQPQNRFSARLELEPYSLGLGAYGLPGDFSSASRFVRCAYIKENAIKSEDESQSVSQVFHILNAVSQYDGCVQAHSGFEKTIYSVCCNASKGIFYYKTYYNSQITAIKLNNEELDSSELIQYPFIEGQQIAWQN